MKDLNTGNLWLWERGKFMNRRYMMQEMYQQFLDEDDAWKKVAKDQVRNCKNTYAMSCSAIGICSVTCKIENHFKNGIIWVNSSFYILVIFTNKYFSQDIYHDSRCAD